MEWQVFHENVLLFINVKVECFVKFYRLGNSVYHSNNGIPSTFSPGPSTWLKEFHVVTVDLQYQRCSREKGDVSLLREGIQEYTFRGNCVLKLTSNKVRPLVG